MEESKTCVLPEKPKSFNGFWASVSKIKTYESCPCKYKYNYIDKLPKKTYDFHITGKFAHFILEHFYLKRLDGDIRPDNVLMKECFKAGVKEYEKDLTQEQKTEVHKMMVKFLEKLIKQKEAKKSSEVLSVEEEFYIDIEGKVLIQGYIDRVQMDSDSILHVADYKTSKSKKYLEKDDFQLMTYAFVKCLQDPSIKKIRTSYIMLKHDFDLITFEFDREQVMKVQDLFLNYADEILKDKLHRPNPTILCKWCDFSEHCVEGQNFINALETKKNGKSKKTWGKCGW
jgi:CRISPR/Cas system-associated exonuclease Cas4 (RecB family)